MFPGPLLFGTLFLTLKAKFISIESMLMETMAYPHLRLNCFLFSKIKTKETEKSSKREILKTKIKHTECDAKDLMSVLC